MNELTLVQANDPVLKTACIPFDFANPPMDPEKLAKSLVEAMAEFNGIGLSANQVGLPWRVFAMVGYPVNFVLFNPRIVDTSEETDMAEEGCLSYPGIVINIKRPHAVRIRFQGPDGETYTKQFGGMTARIICHEMEHMDGKNFIQNISKLRADIAIKKAKKHYNFKFDYKDII